MWWHGIQKSTLVDFNLHPCAHHGQIQAPSGIAARPIQKICRHILQLSQIRHLSSSSSELQTTHGSSREITSWAGDSCTKFESCSHPLGRKSGKAFKASLIFLSKSIFLRLKFWHFWLAWMSKSWMKSWISPSLIQLYVALPNQGLVQKPEQHTGRVQDWQASSPSESKPLNQFLAFKWILSVMICVVLQISIYKQGKR